MKKGDILYGQKNTEGGHPIVYLKNNDEMTFIGVMLTKNRTRPDNVPMLAEHFKNEGLDGEQFSFQINNTHLVAASLLKKKEWEPFEKVGELTNKGIIFVESIIADKDLMFWDDYRTRA